MIARVADHCFWLGRYLERAESSARHLRVTETLALDAELPPRRVWGPLVIVSGQREDFVSLHGEGALGDADCVRNYLVRDLRCPVSLARSIAAARDSARSIREVVSLEVFQTINELHVYMSSEEAERAFVEERDDLYARAQRSTQLALGLLDGTMLHDAPLDVAWLGVLLERVGQTARLLDVEHHALVVEGAPHPVLETALWLSLLRACSGFEAFMKRNRGKVSGSAVAAFLILERRFPRSVRYCIAEARDRLMALRSMGVLGAQAGPDRLTALTDWIAELPTASLEGPEVHEVLSHVVQETHAVCDAVGRELLGQTEGSAAQASPALQ